VASELENRVDDAVQDIASALDEEIYVFAPPEQKHFLLETALVVMGSFLLKGFLDGVKQATISDPTSKGIRRITKTIRARFSKTLGKPQSAVEKVALENNEEVADQLRELAKRRTPEQLEALVKAVQLDFQRALMDEGMSASSSVAVADKLGRYSLELLNSKDVTAKLTISRKSAGQALPLRWTGLNRL
jgi:hypothetical protein